MGKRRHLQKDGAFEETQFFLQHIFVHDLSLDQVGGTAAAQRHTRSDNYGVAVLHQALLQGTLHRQGENAIGGVDLAGEEGIHAPADSQLTADLLLHGEGRNGAGRTEPADHPGGTARVGGGQDGGSVQVHSG